MKIKYLFLGTIILLIFSFSQQVKAQEMKFDSSFSDIQLKSKKYGVLVADEIHFQAAIDVAEKLNIRENKIKFEVVIVGKTAQDIVENPDFKKYIDRSEKLGVDLVVCENALDFFKADRSKMDSRLKTTPNGMVRIFELNDQGYNTVTLQRAG